MKFFKKNKENIKINELKENNVKSELDKLIEFNYSDECLYMFKEQYIRKIVNKIAMWYEIKYPTIDKEITSFDTREFFNNLPINEGIILRNPAYERLARLDIKNSSTLVELSKKGNIKNFHLLFSFEGTKVNSQDFIGKNIKELVKYLKDNNIEMSEKSDLTRLIKEYDNSVYFKEELLRCICYTMLDYDKSNNGVYRCIKFINDFKVKIDETLLNRFVSQYNIRKLDQYLESDIEDIHVITIGDKNFGLENARVIKLLKEYNYDLKFFPKVSYEELLELLDNPIKDKYLNKVLEQDDNTKAKVLKLERKLNK